MRKNRRGDLRRRLHSSVDDEGVWFSAPGASERLRYLVSTVAAARILRVSWKLTSHVRFDGHSVAQEFCPGTILRQRGGCLRLSTTSWQKRTPRESNLRTLCESTKPHGGQKMSAYLTRSYNLLDADGAEGHSSTQQNCGRSIAPTRLRGRQSVGSVAYAQPTWSNAALTVHFYCQPD